MSKEEMTPQREYIRISEVMGITPEGLLDDSINVWAEINTQIMIMETFEGVNQDELEQSDDYKYALKLLNGQKRTYKEYIEETWSDSADEIIKLSSEEKIQQFDALIEEFNKVASQNNVTIEIAEDFLERAALLIQGKKS